MISPDYPPVSHALGNFTRKNPWVSVDFEFNPESPVPPDIVGLSSGAAAVSVPWSHAARQVMADLEREKVVWVGHNSLTTEKPIIEAVLGTSLPLDRVGDTMVLHYLCNSHLCKNAAKDDEQEERGAGYMDLWSMTNLYTDLPAWKSCRGAHCAGPCPMHDKYGYNGVDAIATDIAYPALLEDARQKNIPEKLVTHLKELVLCCDAMQRQGIKVDRDMVRQLDREMAERKAKLFPSRWEHPIGKKGQPLKSLVQIWDAPFNPKSPKQVEEYFKAQGIYLEDTSKDSIKAALEDLTDKTDPVVAKLLEDLFMFKNEGKGLKSWFDDSYFHADGLMHPRFIAVGTSLGRLSSANPNFQNIPKHGFGAEVRKVIVPRNPGWVLAKADKRQLELRQVLWYAGVYESLPYLADAFTWLVEASDGAFHSIAEHNPEKDWSPRDWAKSVSHGANYLEGIKILYGKDLASPTTKRLIDRGALLVYRDWEAFGGVIGFTGSNLATRVYGDASWENRKKALQIQEVYFNRFPQIRQWHRDVTAQAERGYLQSASGRYLRLDGDPEDRCKIAAAFFGQGGGADDVTAAMIRFHKQGFIPLLSVHDEIVLEFPPDVTDDYLKDVFSLFTQECPFQPGFRGSIEIKVGPNWKAMRKVGEI